MGIKVYQDDYRSPYRHELDTFFLSALASGAASAYALYKDRNSHSTATADPAMKNGCTSKNDQLKLTEQKSSSEKKFLNNFSVGLRLDHKEREDDDQKPRKPGKN